MNKRNWRKEKSLVELFEHENYNIYVIKYEVKILIIKGEINLVDQENIMKIYLKVSQMKKWHNTQKKKEEVNKILHEEILSDDWFTNMNTTIKWITSWFILKNVTNCKQNF